MSLKQVEMPGAIVLSLDLCWDCFPSCSICIYVVMMGWSADILKLSFADLGIDNLNGSNSPEDPRLQYGDVGQAGIGNPKKQTAAFKAEEKHPPFVVQVANIENDRVAQFLKALIIGLVGIGAQSLVQCIK